MLSKCSCQIVDIDSHCPAARKRGYSSVRIFDCADDFVDVSVTCCCAVGLSGIFPGAERSGLRYDSLRRHLRHRVRCWSR